LLQGYTVVLDVGKSLAKMTLWSPDGRLIERRTRKNSHGLSSNYLSLDYAGIATWLIDVLADYGRGHDIAAIIPVGHGAAAAVLAEDNLSLVPLDYEAEPPPHIRESYLAERDAFALTGSPALPGALNLGLQLHWLETLAPEKMLKGRIVTWPQVWAWYLSGVAATEVTSLGCHTDLWLPGEGRPSPLAVRRGWAERFAPLRRADERLGRVKAEWRRACALPDDCMILCGLHDSNAALLATRRYAEVTGCECSVISTGTWFIAMRAGTSDTAALSSLREDRDCLINVDAFGAPVPSARFMGGREVEIIEQPEGARIDPAACETELLALAAELVGNGVFALPTFQPNVGPYPHNSGGWNRRPGDQKRRRAGAGLYLALMTDAALGQLGSQNALILEGRFAGDAVFARTLAALRPHQRVYLAPMQDNVPLGALQLISPLPPQGALKPVEPLDFDVLSYATEWRRIAEAGRNAA